MKKDIKKISKFMYLVTDVAKMFGILALVITISIPLVSAIMFTRENVNLNEIYVEETYEENDDYKSIFLDLNDIANDFDIEIVHNNKVDVKAFIIVFGVKAIEYILLLGILNNLCKIFKNIKNEETPFIDSNVNYTKKVSKYILLVTIIPPIVAWMLGKIFDVIAPFTLKIVSVVYALTTIAIVKMLEYGCELQKESDETL